MSTLASCYVYYRVSQKDASQLRSAVHALMDDLRARTGAAARLARRRDDAGMWMEIYDGIADTVSFERELNAATARHELSRWLDGDSRKTEIFLPMGLRKG